MNINDWCFVGAIKLRSGLRRVLQIVALVLDVEKEKEKENIKWNGNSSKYLYFFGVKAIFKFNKNKFSNPVP